MDRRLLLTLFLMLCLSFSKSDTALETVDEIIGSINDGLSILSKDFRGIIGIFTSQITDMRMEDLTTLIETTTSVIFDVMESLYQKQQNYGKRLNEQFLNVILELNGIDGRLDEVNGLVYDLNGNIIDVRNMLQELDGKFDNVTSLLINLDDKMMDFSNQLSVVNTQIAAQTLQLTMTIKFQAFLRFIKRLDRYYNQMSILIASYHTNHTALVNQIDLLIEEYRADDIANQILHYLTLEYHGTKSFIDTFIEFAIDYEMNRKSAIDAAPNKMIYDFLIYTLTAVNRGFSVLNTCYKLKDELLQETHVENYVYVELNRRTIVKHIVALTKNSLMKVESMQHMENYFNLQVTGNANPQAFAYVRKVYIKKVTAETGFVVTGVRFRVDRGIVFLQIQVGRLLMMGMIDQRSLHWQRLPDIINDSDVVQLDAGDMYFGMDKYFFADRFITGIKMMSVSNVLRLQLYGKKVEIFGLGIMKASDLGLAKSILAYNETSLSGSLQGISPNGNNGFQITNDKMLVLQQSLAPYLDGSDITFDVKAPLAGVGFYHYTNSQNYLGFIRPYVVALNYTTLF